MGKLGHVAGLLVLSVLAFAAAGPADSLVRLEGPWEVWSEDGRFVLRGRHGKRLTALSERRADGLHEVWSRDWPRGFPHQHKYVSDDGRYVVGHRNGEGTVVGVMGPGGEVVATYELAEVLPQSEIDRVPVSQSFSWWNRGGEFFFLPDRRHFCIATAGGTVKLAELATGKLIQPTDATGRDIESGLVNRGRTDLAIPLRAGRRLSFILWCVLPVLVVAMGYAYMRRRRGPASA